jgi:hypothetical protein
LISEELYFKIRQLSARGLSSKRIAYELGFSRALPIPPRIPNECAKSKVEYGKGA